MVQMNLDGEGPRCGVGGIMPFELETQRTIKKGEIRALYMALCKLSGRIAMYSDNRGVVQALNKGEDNCIAATHRDAVLWILVWDVIDDLVETGVWLKVTRIKPHTTGEEKDPTTSENRHSACTSVKMDELAKRGAEMDGSEFAKV